MYTEFREFDIDRHVQSAESRTLLARWRNAASPGGLPDIDAFWREDHGPCTPWLLKVLPTGDGDWRHAEAGVAWRDPKDSHPRREFVSGLVEPERSFVRRIFAATAARREPTYAVDSASGASNVLLQERLMLPCRMADGRIAILAMLRPLEFVEDMIRALIEAAPSGILRARCVRDDDGAIIDAVCLFANSLAATLLDRPLADLVTGRLEELLPEFVRSGALARCVSVAHTREASDFEIELRQGDQDIWLSISAVPLADGFALTIADITALKFINHELERVRSELIEANDHLELQARKLEAAIAIANEARTDLEIEVECRKVLEGELRRLALSDTLTGLANRPAVAAHGQALTVAAARRGLPLSVVGIDVDHFKRINDTYGHATGDRVLATLASRLQGQVRGDLDLAGRVGGEEFLILLPRTDLIGAEVIAERIRAELAALPIETNAGLIPVTASFGVAQWRTGEDFDDLLGRCDEALYAAKRAGRNRVCQAADAEPRQAA
jgi:diguanylate cyclase (GGDEF)-like protein